MPRHKRLGVALDWQPRLAETPTRQLLRLQEGTLRELRSPVAGGNWCPGQLGSAQCIALFYPNKPMKVSEILSRCAGSEGRRTELEVARWLSTP